MDINSLMNYTVSTNTINGAINFSIVLLISIISTSISAGLWLNLYNNTKNKKESLFIESIKKFKSRIKIKKKERV
jgi:hypothetical protein